MQRLFENFKYSIVHFKLDLCCFVARVRVGILLFGFFNLISSVVSIISVATGSFPPLYMHAQQSFMEGEYVKSSGAVAYAAELCASVLLLCGLYRADVVLLQYYTRVGAGMAACSLAVYAMVIGILDMLTTILIIVSLSYQVYLILLVRSAIVEIKQEEKQKRYVYRRTTGMEATYYTPIKKYSIVVEPDTSKIEREDSPVLPAKAYILEPGTSEETKPKDEITNDTLEEGTANEEIETGTGLSYPFKFVAIKIPKEGMSRDKDEKHEEIKKEKETEQGVAEKSVKSEVQDKTDEEVVREIIKPPKRSIFGRRKKDKVDSKISKTTVDKSKKP